MVPWGGTHKVPAHGWVIYFIPSPSSFLVRHTHLWVGRYIWCFVVANLPSWDVVGGQGFMHLPPCKDSIPGLAHQTGTGAQQAGIALGPRPQLSQLHGMASIHPSLEGNLSLTTTRSPTTTTCPLSLTAWYIRWRISCHIFGVGISEHSRRDAPGPSCRHWRDKSIRRRRLLLHAGILPLPSRHFRQFPRTRHDHQRDG